MAKQTESPKGEAKSAAEPKAAETPKKPEFPISAKKFPEYLKKDAELPACLTIDHIKKRATITFEDELPNVFNSLNKYTDELREAMSAAKIEGWMAIFMANRKRFISSI